MTDELVEKALRAAYDYRPYKVISDGVSDRLGLPKGAVIPYDLFLSTGGKDDGVRRTIIAVTPLIYNAAIEDAAKDAFRRACCGGKPRDIFDGILALAKP